MKKLLLISMIIFLPLLGFAQTQPNWQMPYSVTEKNTKVRFEVDTTWHMVHGKVNKLTGNIALLNPADPFSLTAEINIQVKDVTTGWGMRDSSFWDSMGQEKYPEIIYKATSFTPDVDCNLETINAKSCNGVLEGTLKIRDVERAISLGVVISKKKDQFLVKGNITFPWSKFNVEDPSIMMAKVKPDVTVFYEVLLPATAQ